MFIVWKEEIYMCCKLMKKCCCLVVIAMIAGAVFYFLCGLKGEDMYEEGSFGKKMQDKTVQRSKITLNN